MQEEEPSGLGFGGGRRGRAGKRQPLSVVMWLLIINIAVFLLQYLLFPGKLLEKVPGVWGFVPMGYVSLDALKNGEVWRLLTYMFVHGSLLHLVFNMFGVFMVGRVVLNVVGPKHFLWVYALGGIGAALAQVWISPAPIVGASGALFALMVMFGMILWDTPVMALVAFIPVRLRARILVAGIVLLTVAFFLIDLLLPSKDVPMVSGVAHMAHLGGALVGYYYAKFMKLGGRTPTLGELQAERQRRESGHRKVEKKTGWTSKFNKEKVVEATLAKSSEKASDIILEKVNAHGLHSLTKEEREVLVRESEELAKRK